MKIVAKNIYNRIMAAEKIILVPHQNPDGDTLGSVSAFMEWLRSIDKAHVAYCKTGMSQKLRYLPHVDYVTQDENVWTDPEVDMVIVFDSGDLRYAGVADQIVKLPKKPVVINFDHHNTNEFFGDENMVNTIESSTTAVLYYFFVYNKIDITSTIATCLLTGLITDTDQFTNGATSTTSLLIGSKLMQKGGNVDIIKQWIFKDKTIKGLQLWGTTLSRLVHHKALDIVYTYVTQDDLKKHHVSDAEVEGIANFLNNLNEGRTGMILKELPDGKIKGSFRTTRDDTDVSRYAQHFGGGGHKKAAGFTVDGPVHHAIEYIISSLMALEGLPLVTAEE